MPKSAVKITPIDMEARKALQIRPGDTVRVWQKIVELKIGKSAAKKKEVQKQVRRQAFEGTVLAVKHGTEPGAMFTVRKVASGVGVEKIFPLYAPSIDEIEVLRRARVRRAKLYFIRRKAAREVSRAMRRARGVVAPAAEAEAPAETPSPQEHVVSAE
jgi:large subunit ribosomal protein L19